jgi:hypothetical protein
MSDDKERIILDQRYIAAFNSIDDQALSSLSLALEDELRDALAKVAGLSADAFDSPEELGGRVRDGIARRRMAHDIGALLSEPCTQYSIEKLGDSSEDPSLEELQELLPEIIEKFGLDAVRLMAIQYSRALKGFRQLVSQDERFAVARPPEGPGVLEKDEAVQAAKRAARKERKDRERAARAKQTAKR